MLTEGWRNQEQCFRGVATSLEWSTLSCASGARCRPPRSLLGSSLCDLRLRCHGARVLPAALPAEQCDLAGTQSRGGCSPALLFLGGSITQKQRFPVHFPSAPVWRHGICHLESQPMEALGGYSTDSGSDADIRPAVQRAPAALPSASVLFTEAHSGPHK